MAQLGPFGRWNFGGPGSFRELVVFQSNSDKSIAELKTEGCYRDFKRIPEAKILECDMPLFPSRPYAVFFLAALVLSSAQAYAGTSTGNFKVTLTIQSECKLNSTTDIAFGTSGVIQTALTANGTLGVQCTNATPYNIGLSAGAGAGATIANRIMTSGTGSTIGYSLYRDTAFTQAWGFTVASNTMAATGSGAVQTYTVYGRVPAQTTPAAGSYSDTVQVTITY